MTYTVKAVETVRATKAQKGVVGIQLRHSTAKNTLTAIVNGVSVPLYETSEGKVSYKRRDFSKYEAASEALLSRELDSAQKYLDAKYCIRQKSYQFLVDLARQGKCLKTKAELKAEAEAQQGEAKAV